MVVEICRGIKGEIRRSKAGVNLLPVPGEEGKGMGIRGFFVNSTVEYQISWPGSSIRYEERTLFSSANFFLFGGNLISDLPWKS